MVQSCSGVIRGEVFIGELYTQRFKNLIYLHSGTDCFMKISLQPSEQIQLFSLDRPHGLYSVTLGDGAGIDLI